MNVLKIKDIVVSNDRSLQDKENGITPYVSSILDKLYHEIPKGKESTLKKWAKRK